MADNHNKSNMLEEVDLEGDLANLEEQQAAEL
jgi:hypothetical protein